jgi:hypothetical protein
LSKTNEEIENQSQELPPEQQPVPLTFLFMGEDAEGRIVVAHSMTIGITPLQVAQMMFTLIPEWLKDSHAPIPMDPSKDQAVARGQQQLLETGRIAMKGFVSASGMLFNMAKDLYGPDFQMQPRADSLPIMSRWMAWFVASQVSKAPLEIIIQDGIITNVRQSQHRTLRESDTEASRDYSEGEGEG